MAADYVKVTTAPTDWSGDYLIVYEAGNVAFDGSLTALDAVGNTIDVTIEEGKIAATDATNAAKFTIAAVTGGYSIQAASGKYIGIAGNSNGLKTADEVGDYTHDLSIDDNENAVIKANFSGSTMTMRFNAASNQLRFRYYKSGQQAVALYKYVDEEQEGTVKTVYCKVAQDWWKADGAAVGIYAFKGETKNAEWPGVRMTAVEGETDLWKADIDTAIYSTVIFTRMNPSNEGNQDWGAKTADLEIPADKDLYTITSATEVWGDPGVTGTWSVYGEEEGGDEPEVVLPVVALAGSMNEWSAEANVLANAEDSLSASVKIALEVGTYEFKVVSDGKWLSLNGEGETLYGIHREWNKVEHINGIDLRNFKLTADVAGDYTFTWTYADSTLLVTFPEAPIEQTPNYYIIGAGEAFGDWSFVPVMQDTFKLSNLEAGDYMFRIAFEEDNWENTKGYSDLTEKTEGLSANADNNILFTLAEAGDVAVVYNDSVFKLIGNFYVEPAKEYYAKYADAWTWVKMTEAEGLWLTDTIVYKGIGININDKADDENNMFYSNTVEEEGVRPIAGAEIAENDTVLFSFNPADSVVTAIMVGKYVPQLPVVGLGANFNGWDWPENLFVPAEDNLSASFKITLGVTDTIEFKIVSDGSWLSLNGEGESLYGLHRNWPKAEHVNIINDGRNFSLTTDVAGEYIFTWTYADSTLVVTFPAAPVDPTEHTYTVAGNLADAFGTAWDPTNEANDMVKQEDGTYKWEKAELTLAAGTVQFKVCEDHAWDVAYPASDYKLNIAEQGEYTITITFNPETKAVDAVATKTGDAEVTVNYYLVGSVKGWEAKAENIFTLNAEAGEGIEEYMIETTLAVGEGLKVVSSTGAWYPEGMGNEYVVDQNHAGATTIYFRPAYNEEWAAFGGYMYVVPTTPTALDEIMAAGKAVKIVRNGQILIIKGEKIFNAQGQLVK